MNIQSITEIREHRDNIKNSLHSFRVYKFNDRYGNEQEYTAQGIRAGVESILIDVTALTKAPAKFIQKSTCAERRQIGTCLENVNLYIEDEDLHNLAIVIDEIKPILRSIDIRHTDERMEAFDEHINKLQRKASSLSQHIADVEEIKSDSNELQEEISNIHQKLTEDLELLESQRASLTESLTESISSTAEERSKLSGLLSEDRARSKEIEQLLATSRSHEEVIENFSKRVVNRESQLEKQEIATELYKEELEVFRNIHENYLSDAKELIESAKLALEYKTAEGLSAAFTEQYNKADNINSKGGWLGSASVFVAGAVFIGFWLTTGETLRLEIIIGRALLLPILIAAAWFCAGQYVKQKNIAEDYAYKAALAKSIVGFSDQLSTESNKGEDHSYFVQRVLSQMLNDPLRKYPQKTATRFSFGKGDKDLEK